MKYLILENFRLYSISGYWISETTRACNIRQTKLAKCMYITINAKLWCKKSDVSVKEQKFKQLTHLHKLSSLTTDLMCAVWGIGESGSGQTSPREQRQAAESL